MKLFDWFRGKPEPQPETRAITADTFRPLGLVANPSAAGIPVNTRSALSIPAVYAAVSSVADAIATLPLPVMRVTGQGGDKAYEHYVYGLLNKAPNPYQTAKSYRQKMVVDMISDGEHFSEIERNGDGSVRYLWPVLSQHVTTQWTRKVDDRTGIETFEFTYRINGRVIDPANLIHVMNFSLCGYRGTSAFELCRDSVGMSLALERFGSAFFKHGARPSGILSAPAGIQPDDQEAARQVWVEANSGAENVGKTAVLPSGFEYKPFTVNPQEAQVSEARTAQIREAQRICRVPPPIVADFERQTWSNIQYSRMDYVQNTLRPLCVAIEQELNRKLLTLADQDTHYIEHTLEGLLRGSFSEQVESLTKACGGPFLTANEARKIMGYDEHQHGDELGTPDPQPADQQPTPEDDGTT